ncbi:MAG: OsmC family peroxiredoxin [Cytophagales bacterium]|nr:OsmC family peroxiredoxin [Cytophagales bacterium]
MKRHATAFWQGLGEEGRGLVTTQSNVLQQTLFTFNSRFADEAGTNPEELLAAAHASCFAMKLGFVLREAGFAVDAMEATSYVNFQMGSITGAHLVVKAKIAGISREVFEASVKEAERWGPVGRVLDASISVEATLEK